MSFLGRAGLGLLLRDQRTLDFGRFLQETESVPLCPSGVAVRDLPDDCREMTETPAELFAKLDDWGHASIVIPHGTAWGSSAPPGAFWDAQIATAQDDPRRQTLVEIYSGHGNSEEYRDFNDVILEPDGSLSCPEVIPGRRGFVPGCQRAGQIIGERCRLAGIDDAECQVRIEDAKRNYLAAGKAGFRTVPGASGEDWLNAGQCQDCFLPAYDYRPRMSAQYMLVRQNFSGAQPAGQRFGFIGSSDVHSGRPGTGYKELNRSQMTESRGLRKGAPAFLVPTQPARPRSTAPDELPSMPMSEKDIERIGAFLSTGGLVAVHAAGRDRDSIWGALEAREVYGTSGERMLLWFDLLNPREGGIRPMGSEVSLSDAPRFRVRAAVIPACASS